VTPDTQSAKEPTTLWAVVPAAGFGSRMSSSIPKQYLPLAGKPVLQHTIDTLLGVSNLAGIVVVVAKNDPYWPALPISQHEKIHSIPGGATRADSVLAGVNYVCQYRDNETVDDVMVLVHDAARALTALSDIEQLIEQVSTHPEQGGLLAVPVQDTLKRAHALTIQATVSRQNLWQAQTPQYFRAHDLLHALQANHSAIVAGEITDEACAMEQTGKSPVLVESKFPNFKITRPNDFVVAEALLAANANSVGENADNNDRDKLSD